MANTVLPKKNVAYNFYIGLIDQSNTKLLKANPTLASGDAKISKDGGAFANLATLPDVDPDAGTAVKIALSATEMNADNVVITMIDAAGAEWCDQLINLQTLAAGSDGVGVIVDDIWDEVNTGATHNVVNSTGRQVRTAAGGTADLLIRSGTAQAGGSNTITLDASASATNNIYNGALVFLTGGTGLGQTRRIVSYNGTTKVATVEKAWITNPDATTTFSLYGSANSIASHEGTAQAGAAGSITLQSTASATDDIYNGSFVTIYSGTGSGQTRIVADYNGTTKVVTTDTNWSVNPDSTSVYAVIPNQDKVTEDVGVSDVNIISVSGDTAAADNLEAMFDGTGYNASASRISTSYALRKNATLTAFPFVMTDELTGAPAPTLTVTAQRSLDGGAFGAMANSVVEVANGVYKINLAAADTNCDTFIYRFTATGANPTLISGVTQS